ncbi:MAG: hypothetical protein NZZ60_06880 [Bacteroidia bacterium]|nr:hypothetical protein [Bacteroidia bacterium]MCX7652897.1 hypothetical protein [Bacteroidia bacterium]MDW8416635.1 hypothetical protein [Bacteroidia bacterium]
MKLGLVAGEKVLSFSPLYFRRIYGLPYEQYVPHSLTELKREITGKGWTGFNVTTPYKEVVSSFLDESSEEAAAIQAVNVVSIYPDGRWRGDNTDCLAARYILSEMSEVYPLWGHVLIMGTGGAARAVAYAHAELFPNIPITFISRQPGRRLPFPLPYEVISYDDCLNLNLDKPPLLVQATPLGMFPELLLPPFPIDLIQPEWLVWDIIYNPNPTPFLVRARARGAHIESGLRLFRKQADYALEIWSDIWQKHYKRRA